MHESLRDVRAAFEEAGITVSDWAYAHGFRRENVYALLAGRTKGRRGQAHRIAAALGLKRHADPASLLGTGAGIGSKPDRHPHSTRIKETPMT